jgi:hypothetical protein
MNEMVLEETHEFQRNYILHHLSLLLLNSCIFDFEAFLRTTDKFEMWCFDFMAPIDLLDLKTLCSIQVTQEVFILDNKSRTKEKFYLSLLQQFADPSSAQFKALSSQIINHCMYLDYKTL